jgi:hypothetical protein
MPVIIETKFAFMLRAMIHGVIATESMPALIASGGDPKAMLCQYKGCGKKHHSVTKASAMVRMAMTEREGKLRIVFLFHFSSGTGL